MKLTQGNFYADGDIFYFDSDELISCECCKEPFEINDEAFYCKETEAIFCRNCEIKPYRLCSKLDIVAKKALYLRKVHKRIEHTHFKCYIKYKK